MPALIADLLADLHRRLLPLDHGRVADYIPELGKADPAWFGIAIATVGGHVYEVGDSRQAFTIQSISKPLVYGMALEDGGPERVARTVGVEPSGEAFNSISLEPGSGRPMNPMINAGAIAASSLVGGADAAARLERVRRAVSAYAGRELDFDEAVYASERDTGHRNRAIGHLLRNYGILDGDPEPVLDLYFHQCALRVDARDLALIGATLANGGLHPQTGQRAVAADAVGPILSVMSTCGVYDFSGEWVYRVGLPAKSGVGGGIVAVLPGQLAIGVFSPALDARGNSVRGVATCEALSRELGLHGLQPPRAAVGTLRAQYSLAQVRSKRQRTAAESAVLDADGDAVQVLELQGDLRFTTLEPVLHALEQAEPWSSAVLDFQRVGHVDEAATRMLAALAQRAAARQRQLVFSRVRRGALLAGMDLALAPQAAAALVYQPQLDLSLEHAERRLLQQAGRAERLSDAATLPLAEHSLCEGMDAAQLQALQALLQPLSHEPGQILLRRGDAADRLLLLLRGQVSVVVDLPGGGQRRLATLGAGLALGEAALVSGGRRSADVRADTAIEALALERQAFERLQQEQPALAALLLRNLLRLTLATTRRLTQEVAVLAG
ncbi:MAG: glutaminase A [Burkholderiaceae bacterium]|nr:glutaminase A [Burkholderiaceae bacterium]